MTTRRGFISMLTAAMATPLLARNRVIFLSPAGGWPEPYASMEAPDFVGHLAAARDFFETYDLPVPNQAEEVLKAYGPDIAAGRITYDAATNMLSLWELPDAKIEAAERQASEIYHRTGRRVYGIDRDTRAEEDDAADAERTATYEREKANQEARNALPIYRLPFNFNHEPYIATTQSEYDKYMALWNETVDYCLANPNDRHVAFVRRHIL